MKEIQNRIDSFNNAILATARDRQQNNANASAASSSD